MPERPGKLGPAVRKIDDRLPITFRWYTGAGIPPVGYDEAVFTEDTSQNSDGEGKLYFRRRGRIHCIAASLSFSSTNPPDPNPGFFLLDDEYLFWAANTSYTVSQRSAGIRWAVAAATPDRFEFDTGNGTGNSSTQMVLNSLGRLGVNVLVPAAKIDVLSANDGSATGVTDGIKVTHSVTSGGTVSSDNTYTGLRYAVSTTGAPAANDVVSGILGVLTSSGGTFGSGLTGDYGTLSISGAITAGLMLSGGHFGGVITAAQTTSGPPYHCSIFANRLDYSGAGTYNAGRTASTGLLARQTRLSQTNKWAGIFTEDQNAGGNVLIDGSVAMAQAGAGNTQGGSSAMSTANSIYTIIKTTTPTKLWVNPVAAQTGIIIKAATSQTADLVQWHDSTGAVVGGVDETGKRLFFGTTAPAGPDGRALTDFSLTFIAPAGSSAGSTGREGFMKFSVSDVTAANDYFTFMNNISDDASFLPVFFARSTNTTDGSLGFVYDASGGWVAGTNPGVYFQVRDGATTLTSTNRPAFAFQNITAGEASLNLTTCSVNGAWTYTPRIDNEVPITLTHTVSGSSAAHILALTPTWNTTGSPPVILCNVTNTASNSGSLFAKFQIDSTDKVLIGGVTQTGSAANSLLNLAQTWNTSGNPTAILLNITNTASGASAHLLALQVGGNNMFKVSKAGETFVASNVLIDNGAELRLYEPTVSGTNYNAFKTIAQVASVTYTLPTAAPTLNGQAMTSTTGGVMSWVTLTTGTVTGTGTTNNLTKWTDGPGGAIGDSNVTDDATTLSYAKRLAWPQTSPTSIGSNQNDYNPGDAYQILLTASTTVNITGFANGSDGRVLRLTNIGSSAITITHQDVLSAAANRIIVPGSANLTLSADQSITLVYQAGVTNRWRVTNSSLVTSSSGAGTSGMLAKWTSASALGDSSVLETGGAAEFHENISFDGNTRTVGGQSGRTIAELYAQAIYAGNNAGLFGQGLILGTDNSASANTTRLTIPGNEVGGGVNTVVPAWTNISGMTFGLANLSNITDITVDGSYKTTSGLFSSSVAAAGPAYVFNTTNTITNSGADIVRIRNNSTTRWAVDGSGAITHQPNTTTTTGKTAHLSQLTIPSGAISGTFTGYTCNIQVSGSGTNTGTSTLQAFNANLTQAKGTYAAVIGIQNTVGFLNNMTVTNVFGNQSLVLLGDAGGTSTHTGVAAFRGVLSDNNSGGGTINVTDVWGVRIDATDWGNGTDNVTNLYGFYMDEITALTPSGSLHGFAIPHDSNFLRNKYLYWSSALSTAVGSRDGGIRWNSTNSAIEIEAGTTAIFGVTSTDARVKAGKDLRIYESDNSNYTAFKVGTQSADLTYTLPTAHAVGRLANDGSGTLTWAGEAFVRKTSDEIVNNSAVLQADDVLLFSVAASEVWTFEFYIKCDSATARDIQFSIVGPTGSTVSWGAFPQSTAAGAYVTSSALAGGDAVTIGTLGVGTSLLVLLKGILVNSTNSGTLALQWAQASAGATDTTVSANSYVKASKVG